MRHPHLVAFAAAALAAPGCQRVNQQKTVSLAPGEVVAPFIVDAPATSQTVSVTVTPSGAPVDVYVVLEKDREAAQQELEKAVMARGVGAPKEGAAQSVKNSLGGQANIDKETTVTGTVPAKNAYAVIVGNPGKTTSVGAANPPR